MAVYPYGISAPVWCAVWRTAMQGKQQKLSKRAIVVKRVRDAKNGLRNPVAFICDS